MNAYDFTVKKADGSEISLAEYKGKVLLIVNTATGCGFTSQYSDLQELYDEHAKDGLEILDFPCNQFGEQAPGTNEEIHTFCTGKYGITFPQFAKIDVIGDNAIPLYKWLSSNSTFAGFSGMMGMIVSKAVKKQDKDYKNNNKIKWNFTKFIINREGFIEARIEPTTSMKEVKRQIEALL